MLFTHFQMTSRHELEFISIFSSFWPGFQVLSRRLKTIYGFQLMPIMVLLVFPIISLAVTHVQSMYYDINDFDLYSSIGFGVTNLITTLCTNVMSGVVTWHLMDTRIRELQQQLQYAELYVNTTLTTHNLKRISKCKKEMYSMMSVYFVPVQLYKVFISTVWALWILPTFEHFLITCVLFVIVTFLLKLCAKYFEKKFGKTVGKNVVFNPENPDGYNEDTITEKEFTIIREFASSDETRMRLSLGHTIDLDKASAERAKYMTQRSIVRTMLIDLMSSIVFVMLLATSSRSTAQNMSSILHTIGFTGDALYKWNKIYLLDEFNHLLTCLKHHQMETKTTVTKTDIRTVTFNDVSMVYYTNIFIPSLKDSKKSIIVGLNVRLEKGKVHYITGDNGGGKSSFLKLFFNKPENGTILFDDININQIGIVDRWRLIYILKQINEGVPMPSKEVINQHKKQYPDMANRFGLTTLENIGGNGSNGSGGQEQRVQIFMALTANTPIVLLDEPFSALDVHWKHIIEEALIDVAQTKLVVVVGHGNYEGVSSSSVTKWQLVKATGSSSTALIKLST